MATFQEFYKTCNGGLDGFTQEQLAEYVVRRTEESQMIFEDSMPSIKLECLDNQIREYCIPTSLFASPGTEPYAWGAIGLAGCTLMTMIKEPSANDISSGEIYMAHYDLFKYQDLTDRTFLRHLFIGIVFTPSSATQICKN